MRDTLAVTPAALVKLVSHHWIATDESMPQKTRRKKQITSQRFMELGFACAPPLSANIHFAIEGAVMAGPLAGLLRANSGLSRKQKQSSDTME